MFKELTKWLKTVIMSHPNSHQRFKKDPKYQNLSFIKSLKSILDFSGFLEDFMTQFIHSENFIKMVVLSWVKEKSDFTARSISTRTHIYKKALWSFDDLVLLSYAILDCTIDILISLNYIRNDIWYLGIFSK